MNLKQVNYGREFKNEIAQALCIVAEYLSRLGKEDAATPMGAIEMHSLSVQEGAAQQARATADGADSIAFALNAVAAANDGIAQSLSALTSAVIRIAAVMEERA